MSAPVRCGQRIGKPISTAGIYRNIRYQTGNGQRDQTANGGERTQGVGSSFEAANQET